MSESGRRLLVVSGDPDRRERWARVLAEAGHEVSRCAGPAASCAALAGERCPLLEEADLALYDREALVPQLARLLGSRRGYDATLVIAEDDERGRPALFRRVRRSAVECFGSPR